MGGKGKTEAKDGCQSIKYLVVSFTEMGRLRKEPVLEGAQNHECHSNILSMLNGGNNITVFLLLGLGIRKIFLHSI